MAYAIFSAEFARKELRDPLQYLNPEYVSKMMNKDLELRTYFEELLDGSFYCRTFVHERADAPVNSEISVFYRYFISKSYFNLLNKNARSGLLENYASIFPFQVDSSVQIDSVPILDLFEDEFLHKIRQFIDYHVVDSDFSDLENLLIKNIESFRRKNFSSRFPMKYERLRAIADLGSGESTKPDEPVGHVCQHSDRMYRLNEAGVDWYMSLQTACNEVNAAYGRYSMPARSKAYFQYLPEINCCELLLLLERRFYVDERDRYAYLFKKYLFFFGHAVDTPSEVHPVFFIDDALFVCLSSLNAYLFSRRNALELEYELWMMALVHLRTYWPSQPQAPVWRIVDRWNLRLVACYVAARLNLDAHLYYEDPLYPIRHRNFYVRRDTVYRLMFVDVEELEPRHFYELILKAALLERQIRRIVIYNAYTGEEFRITMPDALDAIRNLIVGMHMKIVETLREGRRGLRLRDAVRLCRRYVKHDWPFTDEAPAPETFLIRGKEECFGGLNALEEVEFEPFSLYSFLLTLPRAQFAAQRHFGDNFDDVSTTFQALDCTMSPSLRKALPSYDSRHST